MLPSGVSFLQRLSAPSANRSALNVAGLAALLLAFFFILPTSGWYVRLTENYLPIHTVLEFVGILVSFGICTVGVATYHNARANDILALGVASFACGWLDLGHTLSFSGMPDFVGPSGFDKAIYFWLVSRFTGATCFLYVGLSNPRQTRLSHLQNSLFLAATLWCLLWFWIILWHRDLLPVMFVPGEGLKPLKMILEWLTILISGFASFVFFQRAEKSQNVSYGWIGCASAIYAMSGIFFTVYRDFDDFYNFIGHIYKAIAFIFLYRAVFVECVSRPYDEAKRLALEAARANESKSRFLANVSHEFRTPLGIITGFSELILARSEIEPVVRQWTSMIDRNAKQLNLLIDDLLDLSKAEADVLSLNWSQFSLLSLVDEVVQNFKPRLDQKAIEVTVEREGDVDGVVSDELRIRQILTNLVGNALKFTDTGRIQISLQRTTDGILNVSITDSGIGISVEDAGRLFRPFVQAEQQTKGRFGGTGLGLVISRKLAQLLGGDLRLDKSSLGAGSTFVFTFRDRPEKLQPTGPAAQNVVSIAAFASTHRPSPPNFAGSKILVAEDSLDNQALIRQYLAPTGIAVEFADNGSEACRMAADGKPDLILMDIQMPEMDGFEATAEIRRSGWQGPILAFTAHALQPERERAMNAGFNDYLVKPIAKAALWEALTRHLAGRRTP